MLPLQTFSPGPGALICSDPLCRVSVLFNHSLLYQPPADREMTTLDLDQDISPIPRSREENQER